ncbi:MAG TPA: NfeD family protein, partial [Isosphaeraceae bacterium]
LACDEIIFRKGARMGDVVQLVPRRGPVEALDDRQVESLAARAEGLARLKAHPAAVARALVDPRVEVVSARDTATGAVVLLDREEAEADPRRYTIQEVVKAPGSVLTVTAEEAPALGLADQVVADLEGLKEFYGLRGQTLRVDGPTWVDVLVTTLNNPWMSSLLLFIGLFMLILELKLPGIGLPAITSTLAFLLFFWSRFLSGTADQLEIILFIVGLICLALELFVFPGFGVFGMSGILLILISVVMASHTFVWPTREYEFRQMGQSLLQISLALVAVAVGAVVVGRYFPSLPLFNRMVLKPEPIGALGDPAEKPAPDPDAPLVFLIGETGRTTTVLRPTGKARFGELLVDVTADGFYIEPNSLVQVVEVQGPRVIVKRV